MGTSNRKTATYDNPLLVTYALAMASLNSSAEKARLRGPDGLKGRIVNASGVITTTVTTIT